MRGIILGGMGLMLTLNGRRGPVSCFVALTECVMLGCALHCVCQDSSSQVQEDTQKGVNQNAALAA